MNKEVYTVREISILLGIGLNKAYAMANTNEIPNIKFGRRIIIPKKQFELWLMKERSEEQ